jgi:hypothetical protein
MTGVAAYLTCVITLAAVLCCHHGEDGRTAGRHALRTVHRRRPAWARGPVAARRFAHRLRQEPS